jgi:hypothetical protein
MRIYKHNNKNTDGNVLKITVDDGNCEGDDDKYIGSGGTAPRVLDVSQFHAPVA